MNAGLNPSGFDWERNEEDARFVNAACIESVIFGCVAHYSTYPKFVKYSIHTLQYHCERWSRRNTSRPGEAISNRGRRRQKVSRHDRVGLPATVYREPDIILGTILDDIH